MTEVYLEMILSVVSKSGVWDSIISKHLKIKRFTTDNNISRLSLEISVIKELLGADNSIHDGVLITILDMAAFLLLCGLYKGKMVTSDLSISYLAKVKIGDILNIEVSCPTLKNNLRFFAVKITSKDNIIALGKASFFLVKWEERL